MHRTLAAALVIAAVNIVGAADLAAQARWDWSGRVAPGQTVEIKGVNGEIRAVAASGSEVRVSAEKSARRSDVDDVRIEVIEHSGGVTICAVYPTPSGSQANECRPGSGGRMSTRNNDVQVAFTVQIPAGVHFTGRSVNGSVNAENLSGNVDAHTVNGNVRLNTQGLARAKTVNGSIDVTMGRSDWRNTSSFETVNGQIRLAVAGELNAEVRASTVNGSITSDYPITVQGRFGSRSMTGTIGSGGRTLEMKTVNGSIELKRR